jgi:xylulokinase
MAGTGAFASVPEACRAVVREVSSIQPERENIEVYRAGHRTYQALYPALRVAGLW